MRVCLAAAFVVALLLPVASASAADAVPRDQQFVTVERTVRELYLQPGSDQVEDVLIKNQTTRAVVVDAGTQDLGIRADGERSLEFDEAGSQPRGAGSWMTPEPKQLRIPPLAERKLRVRIRVPRDAGAGTWQGVVLLTVTPEQGDGVVALQEETSVTMLIQVAGEADRDVRVTMRALDRSRWRGGDAVWMVTIANEGDVHESYGGRVLVDAMVAGTRSIRLQSGILLPGERREVRVRTPLREAPDRVQARAEITALGRSGDDAEPRDVVVRASAGTIFVVPWWIPLVLLAALAVVVWRLRARRSSDDDADFDSES